MLGGTIPVRTGGILRPAHQCKHAGPRGKPGCRNQQQVPLAALVRTCTPRAAAPHTQPAHPPAPLGGCGSRRAQGRAQRTHLPASQQDMAQQLLWPAHTMAQMLRAWQCSMLMRAGLLAWGRRAEDQGLDLGRNSPLHYGGRPRSAMTGLACGSSDQQLANQIGYYTCVLIVSRLRASDSLNTFNSLMQVWGRSSPDCAFALNTVFLQPMSAKTRWSAPWGSRTCRVLDSQGWPQSL